MDRVAKGVERRCAAGTVGEAVRWLNSGAEGLARAFKEAVLQRVIDRAVERALRRKKQLTGWSCLRCGPRLGAEVRRNGHYRRRPLTCEGMIVLSIPQLTCTGCGGYVGFSHPLLPRRKRLWLDLEQRLAVLYLEGASYRASRRLLERWTKTNLGLMSLWRSFQAVGRQEHRPPPRAPARYLGVDEVYHKIRGEKHWLLVVRAQAADGRKHYVGAALSRDRSREAWEHAFDELGLSRYNPPFAVLTDGDRAIEEAVLRCFPGVRIYRCTWHVKHNAAEWLREHYPRREDEDIRRGLMAAVDAIVDAPTLAQRQASLDVLEETAPWLTRLLRPALERVPLKDAATPVRTNNLMERGFRELRRRTRPMDGFKSTSSASTFHTLWMLKENARINGRDYLPEILP
jgi:transposase-like protein